MKIAILTYRMSKGYGVDVVVHQQATGLSSKNCNVTVFTLEFDSNYFKPDNYKIEKIQNPISYKFINFLKDQKFDVIIAHTSPFFEILPELSSVSNTIVYEHGDPFPYLFSGREKFVRQDIKNFKQKNVYPYVHSVVAISEFISKDINWNSSTIIYNGADHLFTSQKTTEKSLQDKKITILSVCRLGESEDNYKGLDVFINFKEQFKAQLEKYKFVVAGKGTNKDKEKLEKNNINVLLNLSNEDLIKAYAECDIFVSFSKWEGFNLPLAEAQMANKPALALNCCSHKEITPFTFDSYQEMASFIISSDINKFKEMGKKCFDHISRFTWKSNVDNLYKLLNNYKNNIKIKSRPKIVFFLYFIKKQLIKSLSSIFKKEIKIFREEIKTTAPFNNQIISICILNKDKLEFIQPCIESIMKSVTKYKLEILIGDTGSKDKNVLDFYNTISDKVKIIYLDKYHFSQNNNALSKIATGEYLVFLNNDTLVRDYSLDKLIEPFKREQKIGIVGAKLLYQDGTIQHAGCEISRSFKYKYIGWHPYAHKPGSIFEANFEREVPGVTGACFAIKHELFNKLGGFSENYAEECQDLDLCLLAWQNGYKVFYNPNSVVTHFENGTRTVRESNSDRKLFKSIWKKYINKHIFKMQKANKYKN